MGQFSGLQFSGLHGNPIPTTFAHRGARSEEPENTIAAFRKALQYGATGLETDAWVSKDGDIVLVHDGEVMLNGQKRRVKECTTAELATLNIPTLKSLYQTLGTNFDLSIDLKDSGSGQAMVDITRQYGDPDKLWICSPHLSVLEKIRASAKDVHLVHSTDVARLQVPFIEHLQTMAAKQIDAFNMHRAKWTAELVKQVKDAGLLAFAWDTQQVAQIQNALKMGVDAIYCDDSKRMVTTVNQEFPQRSKLENEVLALADKVGLKGVARKIFDKLR